MPSSSTRPFGLYGERLARTHLEEKGYRIITTNWRCSHGEIDIVAERNNTIVFIEVRSRHAENTELSFESVTQLKQTKLARLAEAYLDEHMLEDRAWQIDVIGIAIPRNGNAIIEHVEDALGW